MILDIGHCEKFNDLGYISSNVKIMFSHLLEKDKCTVFVFCYSYNFYFARISVFWTHFKFMILILCYLIKVCLQESLIFFFDILILKVLNIFDFSKMVLNFYYQLYHKKSSIWEYYEEKLILILLLFIL